MRIGIIDLGTNSVRFDIREIGPGKKNRELYREKLMVRLGQGVFIQGKLNKAAVLRTVEAFRSFKAISEKFRVEKIHAFGTSALRESEDRERFLEEIKTKLGIDLHIISGEEEARLIALGILSSEKNLPKGNYALMDIGGGSTEICLCKRKEMIDCESFPLGTARLQQVFLKASPPKPQSIEQLRRFIRTTVLSKTLSAEWPSVDTIIGSSGTVRALARLAKKNSSAKSFSKKELSDLIKKMSSMSTSELMDLPEMEARRIDMIFGGAILTQECMSALGATKVKVTGFSLRDGILRREVQLYKGNYKKKAPFRLEDLIERATRFNVSAMQIENSISIADVLFEKLKTLHKLKSHWKIYLIAASILKHVGEVISTANQGMHAAYIVKNLDFYTAEPWEVELVSELCVHFAGLKTDFNGSMPFKSNKGLRNVFLKLLALLRVVDALDEQSSAHIKLATLRIHSHKIDFVFRGGSAGELERLRVEQKQPLFVELFGRVPHLLFRK